ncbi:MAG: phosphoribosylformylglycinamidine synthase [Spirochaetales bacterium]|nr:phosphoribosylformylglycinamidine synthase [Spirochaetales bacterium]
MGAVKRIFVEKKEQYAVEAHSILHDIRDNLEIKGLESVRVIHRYDTQGITDEVFDKAVSLVFSEPPVDSVFSDFPVLAENEKTFAVEYLPGQYDQRADSAAQCVQILTKEEKPKVKTARVLLFCGNINDKEFEKIKQYVINPVESHEASMELPATLDDKLEVPGDVEILSGFIKKSAGDIRKMAGSLGLAMSGEDLEFCRDYFRGTEKRDPTITEIRMIDTYWSDHCRHTTFLTKIDSVEFADNETAQDIAETWKRYHEARDFVYQGKEKDICLMDMATIGMKELKKRGILDNLDESDEINACSIEVDAEINGKTEKWLVMFKNETHNHPTEIEPFGGAATCLGGAIRDPLSGRSYVYQAMRVTGAADPTVSIDNTLKGKLPQKKLCTVAAKGYSSYGNQIGLATGQVSEIYHPGYVAKRMEIGAVVGAAPKHHVKREKPNPGDVIILLGGRTGRDGIGGATGSSKEHTEESIEMCGAEVQKGNAPTERKIQRLFRNPKVSTLIKKCNDFGAGGVCVAIGELADGLEINLDSVPKKYEGLDGTELAISESQERMAVMVSPQDANTFIAYAERENLEAVIAARVTEIPRLVMHWRGKKIVDLSREFLNTNGVIQHTNVTVAGADSRAMPGTDVFRKSAAEAFLNGSEKYLAVLSRLRHASQKGLGEMFDSTIGAGSVLMPFGGKTQLTPAEGMAARLPVLEGDTSTGTLMSWAFDPYVSVWSPYHGAQYAVIHSLSKIVAMGGQFKNIRLSLQEYFEKLQNNPEKWGKPMSALLGAFKAQINLMVAAIGGKDSMSGTFGDLDVPPTLVSFALAPYNVADTVSNEFKTPGNQVVYIELPTSNAYLPDYSGIKTVYEKIQQLMQQKKVFSAATVGPHGAASVLASMCFGNCVGFKAGEKFSEMFLYSSVPGSFILEVIPGFDATAELLEITHVVIGNTIETEEFVTPNFSLSLKKMCAAWQNPLENVFPVKAESGNNQPIKPLYTNGPVIIKKTDKAGPPRVCIPVFPGTNCEYDSARAFERAGACAEVVVIKNLNSGMIAESVAAVAETIRKSQIIMIPGGFSAGDEPEGSGKFIAAFFRNSEITDAVHDLLENRDGLMLGICNGFQALVKLGLLPYGKITATTEDSPTLTFNSIGRHVSCMVRTKVVSNLSPWLSLTKPGDIHTIPVSHGEGRFVADTAHFNELIKKGQIAFQYVDYNGEASNDIRFNPNGSINAVEGITSPDGRVLGKMGHSERIGTHVCINVPGEKDQKIFEAGTRYFL